MGSERAGKDVVSERARTPAANRINGRRRDIGWMRCLRSLPDSTLVTPVDNVDSVDPVDGRIPAVHPVHVVHLVHLVHSAAPPCSPPVRGYPV